MNSLQEARRAALRVLRFGRYATDAAYRERNRERLRERHREIYQGRKDKQRAYEVANRERIAEKRRIAAKRRYWANPEKHRACSLRYYHRSKSR